MASSLVLAVVFLFDIIAFALAVVAEQRRNTVSHLEFVISFNNIWI